MQLKNVIKTMVFSLFVGFLSLNAASYSELQLVSSAHAASVSSIDVRGNQRIDDDIVASYLTIEPGQSFNNLDIDDSIKALYATGLFSDVSIFQQGRVLVVDVDENATVNRVFFEGNKRLKDEGLKAVVRISPQGVYSDEQASVDVESIELAYSRTGRRGADVSYEVIPLANNRVNVIYRINEGDKTKIAAINFVGNDTFPDRRLSDEISTKQSNFLSFLSSNDVYDQNRIKADEERLRAFYFNKGFADFQILSASADLDEVANEYVITFTVEEGPRYTFGSVNIESTIDGVDVTGLYTEIETISGENYSAKDVEDTVLNLTQNVAERGFAFVEVAPRGNRNFADNTIDVTYLVDEGARVFIEDIRIVGNDRTRDYVIRREFDISEGDAYNRVLVNQTKNRIQGLGFFELVTITTRPGSQPDRVILIVSVAEQSTGDLSLSGGFSSGSGASASISFTERNFLGRGQYLRVGGQLGQNETSYQFDFREPYFLGYRVSAGIGIQSTRSEDTDDREYSTDSDSATLTFAAPLTQNLRGSVFYTYRTSDVAADGSLINPVPANQGSAPGELSNALAVGLGEFTSSGFGYSLLYSDLDSTTAPREGVRARFSQTFYGAGGDAQYISTDVSLIGYHTLVEEEDIVLFGRARAGHAELLGSDNGSSFRTLDNFKASGNATIRGFDSFGYGPRDPFTDDALGGRTYWNATAELQFPFPFVSRAIGLRAALFADAGQLTNVGQNAINAVTASNGALNAAQLAELDDDGLRASAGVSILWNSPFGPLRADYAFPLASEDYDDVKEFNFGISRDF